MYEGHVYVMELEKCPEGFGSSSGTTWAERQ